MGNAPIFYQSSRRKMECLDFRHFLGLYAPDKLPTGRRLWNIRRNWAFQNRSTRPIHSRSYAKLL
jgi:hypothetical protein